MSKKRLLVIDDEKFFRELYEGILASEDFTVIAVEGGREALELIREESFDVIIADMVMPGWDGIRTIREIRKVSPDQDIIIVTHVSEIEAAVEAMKNGASDYILKPINREDLLYALNRVVKRQKILVEHSRLLQESVDLFEVLSIYKKCLKILSINDFTALMNYVTEAMAEETGSKEAYFWLSYSGLEAGWIIKASLGGSDQRAGKKLPLQDEEWQKGVRAGVPFFRSQGKVNSFFVPFLLQDRVVAVVELSSKRGGQKYDDRDFKFAGIVAEFSQLALNNARKLTSLEDSSLLDKNFGVYSYKFFLETFNKQIFTASRYRRPFSVAVIKIDNLDELKKNFAATQVKNSITGIIEKISDAIRHSDILAGIGEREFYLLLPETDYFGSIMAVKRMEEAIAGVKYVSDGISSSSVEVLTVSASFPRDGVHMDTLMNSVNKRADELRNNLFLKLDLVDKKYWEAVDTLINGSETLSPLMDTCGGICSAAAPYIYSDMDDTFYFRLRDLFVNEIISRPFLRGVLFLGAEQISPNDEFCKKIGQADNLTMRIFVIGKRGSEQWNIPNITPVYLKEGEAFFNTILFLNEEAGYAYYGQKNYNSYTSFHTSDLYTVEKLISKLRDHYLLQWI
ncbi:MAG: response regulator [Deltaproteobacteria bacterium]|nr:response regulator [Deltaproteobacteria bacterium]